MAKEKSDIIHSKGIHIVSTPTLPGQEIKEVKGLVWANSVKAKSFIQDIIALLRIFLGGEVLEYRDLLNEARKEVLLGLNKQAKKMGADAIVSVKLTSTQVMIGTVEIIGYGTAVKLK